MCSKREKFYDESSSHLRVYVWSVFDKSLWCSRVCIWTRENFNFISAWKKVEIILFTLKGSFYLRVNKSFTYGVYKSFTYGVYVWNTVLFLRSFTQGLEKFYLRAWFIHAWMNVETPCYFSKSLQMETHECYKDLS